MIDPAAFTSLKAKEGLWRLWLTDPAVENTRRVKRPQAGAKWTSECHSLHIDG